jgi:hypothetical protein
MSKWNVDPALEVGYNGDILALSLFTMQGRSVYLNLDLVREAGYPEDELPLYGKDNYDMWHWDDFVAFLQAVTHQGVGRNLRAVWLCRRHHRRNQSGIPNGQLRSRPGR